MQLQFMRISLTLITSLLSLNTFAKSIFYFYVQNNTQSKIDIFEVARFNIFYSGITVDNSRIRILPEDKNAVIEYIIKYCDNNVLPCTQSSYKTGCAVNFQNFIDNNPSAVKVTIYPLTDKIRCSFNDNKILINSK